MSSSERREISYHKDNRPFENTTKFRYLETTVKHKNVINEEIKS
jgi:hypothetical protein